eukprot:365526-Chlamydomonas_euryale.AAC.20
MPSNLLHYHRKTISSCSALFSTAGKASNASSIQDKTTTTDTFDGYQASIPPRGQPAHTHLNDRQVRKGKEGTRAGNSFLNRTVPVRDAGIEPTTSVGDEQVAPA